jgi:hypothetical protein
MEPATALVFALVIGAKPMVFSVFNSFLLRPLPYPHGDRLVTVYNTYPKLAVDVAGASIPDYLDRREQALQAPATVSRASLKFSLTITDSAIRARAGYS